MQCLENSNWQQLLHIFSDSLRDLLPKYMANIIKVLKIENSFLWARRENLCPVPCGRVLVMQIGSDGPAAIGKGSLNSRNNMAFELNVQFQSSRVAWVTASGEAKEKKAAKKSWCAKVATRSTAWEIRRLHYQIKIQSFEIGLEMRFADKSSKKWHLSPVARWCISATEKSSNPGCSKGTREVWWEN